MELILQSEGAIRLSAFLGVLVLMALFETFFPRRSEQMLRPKRWLTNVALIAIGIVLARLLAPVLAISIALLAEKEGWGLLPWLISLGSDSNTAVQSFLEFCIAIVLLDGLIYLQHLASHHWSFLWRFHRVHHADRKVDVTTGFRFHPGEIILSMLFKAVCIAALGAPVAAVFVFELLLNLSAMFNHSNVRLPLKLDSVLRLFIVTPDMHRVHHSVIPDETNSNYGFFLTLWDRVFATYVAQPRDGHVDMGIGLEQYQSDKPNSLIWCLQLPFRGQPASKELDSHTQ